MKFGHSRILTGEKHRQINSSAYKKYQVGHLCCWYIKLILYKWLLKWIKIFEKNEAATGKTPFFAIGPFCTHHSICLNITLASDIAILYENDAFLILELWVKKRCSGFLKKVFVLQKICFKVKVLKTFKIITDCHIKTCQSLKQRAISKISSTVL